MVSDRFARECLGSASLIRRDRFVATMSDQFIHGDLVTLTLDVFSSEVAYPTVGDVGEILSKGIISAGTLHLVWWPRVHKQTLMFATEIKLSLK